MVRRGTAWRGQVWCGAVWSGLAVKVGFVPDGKFRRDWVRYCMAVAERIVL